MADDVMYYCVVQPTVGKIPIIFRTVLILGNTSQSEHSEVSDEEGSSITLKCTYSTSENGPYLYWYRQFPNRAPQSMVMRGAETLRTVKTESGLFTERHSTNADKESTNLTMSRLEAGDAVTYHCALQPHSASEPRHIRLYWYRQNSNRALEYILYKGARSGSSESHTADFAKSMFTSTTDSSSTATTISKLALSDTAIYHCALRIAQCEISGSSISDTTITDCE
ncbi:uncharacterized protein LOC121300216 [Polyodon spathula]|uniref:uncharacterized protein LOC121300216 n=1 Tax=Polyodon spathula TaxID=7913 RepID=UPI001B7DCC45|nr:uncharacterized protein LOC121300216 [Polyodon spathula]